MIVDPAVATTRLANGLRVTTVALPHLHTANVALFVKVGSRFETPADSGLSHFVEHMLFRGTEQHPTSLAFNTAVEELGSTLHAETGCDYTLFQLALEPSYVSAGIALLGDLLECPRFADIELERAIVLEEMNEDYDEDGVETNVDDIARGLMFGKHPLGQRIIGPRANVQRFSAADVRRHFATFYGATNALLCVAGPVEHTRVVAAAMAGWFGGKALYFPPPPLSRRLAAISRVTRKDVIAAARRVLRPEVLVLATVGALSRSEISAVRRAISTWNIA